MRATAAAWRLALACVAVWRGKGERSAVELARRDGADGGTDSAAVIETRILDGISVRFLRYGDCLLGARFVDPEYEDSSPFTAFSVMSFAVERVAAKQKMQGGPPNRFLQLGLGIGTVPTFARKFFTTVDAVEKSQVVIDFAKSYFGYAAGQVFAQDALDFLFTESSSSRMATATTPPEARVGVRINPKPTMAATAAALAAV
jgi:hypothetical protein